MTFFIQKLKILKKNQKNLIKKKSKQFDNFISKGKKIEK